VLLDVQEEWGVTILVEKIENLFLRQYLLHLVEDVKVVFVELLVELFHKVVAEDHMGFDNTDCVRYLN